MVASTEASNSYGKLYPWPESEKARAASSSPAQMERGKRPLPATTYRQSPGSSTSSTSISSPAAFPLRPELAAVTAGRLLLRELERLVEAKADFAFESTLRCLRYAKRIQNWNAKGYSIEIVYIRLPSPQLALSRVAARVKQGGHAVARSDVLRRYKRGWANFPARQSLSSIAQAANRVPSTVQACHSAAASAADGCSNSYSRDFTFRLSTPTSRGGSR
jgi:predicted ABC-type ATPase